MLWRVRNCRCYYYYYYYYYCLWISKVYFNGNVWIAAVGLFYCGIIDVTPNSSVVAVSWYLIYADVYHFSLRQLCLWRFSYGSYWMLCRVITRTLWSFTFRRGTGRRTSGSDASSIMRSSAVTRSNELLGPRTSSSAVDRHSGLEALDRHYLRLSSIERQLFLCMVSLLFLGLFK